ncbi:MAG: inorganic phosphate transporter [Chloroflexi bacterium]|nr:inorganic phosphate transporter [Chloroflexota bacterium]
MSTILIIFVALMMLYAFFNGFNNSGTLVAAPISTRALHPRLAIALAVIAEFLGPFLFGVAVAATIGRDFLDTSALNMNVLLATVIAVIVWNATTWFLGIPSSSSHALIGGLSGAALAAAGLAVFRWEGLVKIFSALLLAPVVGFAAGYMFLKLTLFLSQGASPRINNLFRSLQTVTTIALALSHGTNDGQKAMGLITLGLVVMGTQPDFSIPRWVTLAAAAALALGVATGGYRIIRTLGAKMYRLRPIHGLDSQAAAASVILFASVTGAPVASTHVISTSILGVGAATRTSAVRWGVVGQILMAWLITIPTVGVAAGLLYLLLAQVL